MLSLNTWLSITCSLKGLNYIDNCNVFWGHREMFKPEGANLSHLHHPSALCTDSTIQGQPPPPPPVPSHDEGPSNTSPQVETQNTGGTGQPQSPPLENMTQAEFLTLDESYDDLHYLPRTLQSPAESPGESPRTLKTPGESPRTIKTPGEVSHQGH